MIERAQILAPAKVNLFLHVGARRPDGYHDIETLFQAIDLADELQIELAGEGVALEVEGAELGPVADNLAYRAAEAFRAHAKLESGLRIRLTKHIPAGAGLGGGSSDAAAVLRCLAWMTGLEDPASRLLSVAAELGSDVPFFLCGSPLALACGRGERLEALPPLPVAHMVLSLTPVHVSTAAAYRALDEARASRGGAAPRGGAEGGRARGGIRPEAWADVRPAMRNDFQEVVAAEPAIARSLEALSAAGASDVLLSGSGAASFGLFTDAAAAGRAADQLSDELGWPCVAVRTLASLPEPRAT
jgi:4-diphosphocytidyl-2-C-methyl-D-erythritol kinase